MKRLILALGIVLVLAGALSACGKKGPPEAPDENQYPSQYPRKYPAQT